MNTPARIASVSTQVRQPTWKLGALWMLATISSYLWTIIIFWATSQLTDSSYRATLSLVIGILGGIIIAAVAQAILLSLYVKYFRRLQWIFLTTAGYTVGLFVVTLSIYTQLAGISEKGGNTILSGMTVISIRDAEAFRLWLLVNITVTTALTGAVLGYLQSRVLRSYVLNTKPWVLANALAPPIAALVVIIGVMIGPLRISEALTWFLSVSIIGVAIMGLIIGATLVRLLKEYGAPLCQDRFWGKLR